MKEYMEESRRLAYLLNDENCPNDINEQYELFWKTHDPIITATQNLLSSGNLICSLHDCHIENLSQKKHLNNYISSFNTQAFVYEDRVEIGYLPVKFTFTTKNNLRELNNKEIFSTLIDVEKKEFGIMYHSRGKLNYLIFNYEDLNIEKKDVILYESRKKLKM